MARVVLMAMLVVAFTVTQGVRSLRIRDGNCVKVPDMCYKLISNNYTHMRLPNMLNHTRKEDVAGDLNLWSRLLQSRQCNAGNQLKYFLCFTYAPVCVDSRSMNKIIPPCKSMCQAVRQACEPVMRKHNYSWPDVFNCDQKTRFLDDATQMCISSRILAGIQKTKDKQTDNKCSCRKEYKESRLRSIICRSHLVFRGKLLQPTTKSGTELKIQVQRVFRSTKDKASTLLKSTLTMTLFNDKQNCRCHRLRVKKRTRGSWQYFVVGRRHKGVLQVDAIGKWKDMPNGLKKVKQC